MTFKLKVKLNLNGKINQAYQIVNVKELQIWRLKNLLTQEEVAKKFGISLRAFVYIEEDKKSYIKRDTLKKIKEKGLVEFEFVEG